MRAWQQQPLPAVALGWVLALAVIVSLTWGLDGVLVLAVVGLLVAGHFARRYVYKRLAARYPRHGDHMD